VGTPRTSSGAEQSIDTPDHSYKSSTKVQNACEQCIHFHVYTARLFVTRRLGDPISTVSGHHIHSSGMKWNRRDVQYAERRKWSWRPTTGVDKECLVRHTAAINNSPHARPINQPLCNGQSGRLPELKPHPLLDATKSYGSRDRSVSIVTKVQTGRPRHHGPIPERYETFLFSEASRPGLKPTELATQRVPGALSLQKGTRAAKDNLLTIYLIASCSIRSWKCRTIARTCCSYTGMRRITTFRSTTDRTYDGLIRL